MNQSLEQQFRLSALLALVPALLSGFAIAIFILVGIHSGTVAAATMEAESNDHEALQNPKRFSALENAIDHNLISIPGDFFSLSTVPALKSLMAHVNPVLIDVRNPAEYRAGHIIGAINIPLTELDRHLDVIPTDQEVVLYCSTGYRSAMGVMALQLQGFTHVRGFAPSLAGWKAAGEPVSRSEPPGRAQA